MQPKMVTSPAVARMQNMMTWSINRRKHFVFTAPAGVSPGSAWGDWALYTGSPLRAFESKLGVQDPGGFWDPAGFGVDGNTASLSRTQIL